jgi:hypothetical protein
LRRLAVGKIHMLDKTRHIIHARPLFDRIFDQSRVEERQIFVDYPT